MGNPYLQNDIFEKLDRSLTEVIQTIEREQSGMGGSPETAVLVDKFKGWKDELVDIMAGCVATKEGDSALAGDIPAEEGGLFED
jgi:hypothetical protein